MRPEIAEVWRWLEDVPDPEIPAISVVDLGIVRDVVWEDDAGGTQLAVTITPTYSGCPANAVIRCDIERALHARGIGRIATRVRVAPPWTTDWLSEAGHEKLRAYGIAPPQELAGSTGLGISTSPSRVACPRCRSSDVELTSRFGSTPCKALYRCNACREPFDHFKCH